LSLHVFQVKAWFLLCHCVNTGINESEKLKEKTYKCFFSAILMEVAFFSLGIDCMQGCKTLSALDVLFVEWHQL